MPEQPPSQELMVYRLEKVEEGLLEMRGALDRAIGTWGQGMSGLQTQLARYQSEISDKYVPRRDFDALVRRMEEEENRQGEWGWKVLSNILAAAAIIIALISWLHPFSGH